MATVNDQTPNFALELPHPQNHMPEDCTRIRNSLIKVDSQLKKLNGVTDAKLDKTGGMLTGDLLLKSSNLARTPAGDIVNAWGDGCIRLLEKAGLQVGFLHVGEFAPFGYVTALGHSREINGKNVDSLIRVCIDPDGTAYAAAPRSRGLCNTDIATMIDVMDYAPQKLVKNAAIYVGGANASDTADLYNGRGFSADKPFATLLGALAFIRMHCFRYMFTITVQSDITYASSSPIWLAATALVIINSPAENRRKITTTTGFNLQSGSLRFDNIELCAQNASSLVTSNGITAPSHLGLGDGVVLTGTCSAAVVSATQLGTMAIGSNVTGTVTGKKYICSKGGIIIGADKIPGTEGGTCDASSKAIG